MSRYGDPLLELIVGSLSESAQKCAWTLGTWAERWQEAVPACSGEPSTTRDVDATWTAAVGVLPAVSSVDSR